jgi:hypothetical protein
MLLCTLAATIQQVVYKPVFSIQRFDDEDEPNQEILVKDILCEPGRLRP